GTPPAHLNLVTAMEVDGLGRTTKVTDPNQNVTYTVYKDDVHERRTYPGWYQVSPTPPTYATTGPIRVWREDRDHGNQDLANSPTYVETPTMAVTPAADGSGRPTGAEAVANVQTLARSYTNKGGQVYRRDAYFSLAGTMYTQALYVGTAGHVNTDGTVGGNY